MFLNPYIEWFHKYTNFIQALIHTLDQTCLAKNKHHQNLWFSGNCTKLFLLTYFFREGLKKVGFLLKLRTPSPPVGKRKKNYLPRYETKYVYFGSPDTCQMTSLEHFKSFSHPSDQDPSWTWSTHPKI